MNEELLVLKKEPITPTQLVKYAGASGDFNPIHTVKDSGIQAGYEDVIAHGMLVMGFAAEAAVKWFPTQKLRYIKTRFVELTYPGEALTVQGSLSNEMEVNGRLLSMCEIIVVNEEGQKKLVGRLGIEKSAEEGD